MKLTKSDLKKIVKECLVEILSEGLGDTPLVESRNIRDDSPHFGAVVDAASKRQKMLKAQRPSQQKFAPTQALNQAILEQAGGNPILQDIFADTAATTLQKQIERPGGPVGAVEMAIADIPPQDLFGDDNAEKWAQLAFMDHRPGSIAKKSS